MKFTKGPHFETANLNARIILNIIEQVFPNKKFTILMRAFTNVDRDFKFFRKDFHTANVITVLMGDEERADRRSLQSQSLHPLFNFTAADSRIHKNCFCGSTHIIAVTITTGIDGGQIQRHVLKVSNFLGLRKSLCL